MEPPVVVVGDVHLSPEEPEVTQQFLAWLETLPCSCATLILLGDLFEMWLGRPMQTDPLPKAVLAKIGTLGAGGMRIAFMPGNRDVLFRGADGVDIEIWGDPVRTTWGERRVVLTHGDQLCTADRAYQSMRRFIHGPGRALTRIAPYWFMRWLGNGMRDLSTREIKKKAVATMDIDYGEARRWLEAYECDLLVAGHVHTGVHHSHAGPPHQDVMVLKDWEHGGGVVTFDAEGVRLEPPLPLQ